MSVPMYIQQADYLEAMQPLLTLCGVRANEILGEIHITAAGGDNLGSISLNIVARSKGDLSDRPQGVKGLPELEPGPREHCELFWPVTVEIV